MVKKVFLFLLLAVLVLVGVVLIRTLNYPLKLSDAGVEQADRVTENGQPERLSRLLQFETVTHDDRDQVNWSFFTDMQAYMVEAWPLVHQQLQLERVAEHTLLYTWQGSDPALAPLLLMAHQDVVPVVPGTEDQWEQPPYSGAIVDGFIWGRGTMDDKGSIGAILEAVEALLAKGHQPTRTVMLMFGHDEEIGGEGAQAVAALLKQRGVRPALVLDEGGVVSVGLVPGVDAPIALIGIAEKGYASLDLVAKGEGGHSSMPPRQTAAGIIGAAVAKLEQHPFPADTRFISEMFQHLGDQSPFGLRLAMANRDLLHPVVVGQMEAEPGPNASIRTTTAVTMLSGSIKENVLPIEARATVNFRILPGDDIEQIKQRVTQIIDDPRVSLEVRGFASDPTPVSPTEGLAWAALNKSVRESAQQPTMVAPYLVVGATDARHFTGVADNVYRFLFMHVGDGDSGRIHGTNERLSVSDYLTMITFYRQLILNMDQSS